MNDTVDINMLWNGRMIIPDNEEIYTWSEETWSV